MCRMTDNYLRYRGFSIFGGIFVPLYLQETIRWIFTKLRFRRRGMVVNRCFSMDPDKEADPGILIFGNCCVLEEVRNL